MNRFDRESQQRPSVLFICTGNICRSPMAEALFRARLKDQRADYQSWRVESAGTWTTDGAPASKRSVQVMGAYGLDINGHRARTVTSAMLESFDLILTMEPGHKEALCVEFPSIAQRVFLLSEMHGATIPVEDPYGGSLEEYQKAAERISAHLEQGMPRILAMVDARHTDVGPA
jgi:protein-tyrosine-phosphatase